MNWIKPHDCEGEACIEVSFVPSMRLDEDGGLVAVRNSKIPGEIIWFTRDEWEAFLAGVNLGEFNL